MAVNIADLFEHAVDAFPERVAVICGDRRSPTPSWRTGQPAGALPGRPRRRPGRPRRPLRAQLDRGRGGDDRRVQAAGGRSTSTTGTSRTSCISSSRRRPDGAGPRPGVGARVAAVLPTAACRVVVSDGSDSRRGRLRGRASPRRRDFGQRCADDLYMLYTGGTTGYPKGVMWRHEDVWRMLGGGIDFMTGDPARGRVGAVPDGAGDDGMVRLCLAPLIHGNAQWGGAGRLFAGDTAVLLPQLRPARGLGGDPAAQGQRGGAHRRRDGPSDHRGATRPATTTPRRWSRSPRARRCSPRWSSGVRRRRCRTC